MVNQRFKILGPLPPFSQDRLSPFLIAEACLPGLPDIRQARLGQGLPWRDMIGTG